MSDDAIAAAITFTIIWIGQAILTDRLFIEDNALKRFSGEYFFYILISIVPVIGVLHVIFGYSDLEWRKATGQYKE